jgi:hypothetical protein
MSVTPVIGANMTGMSTVTGPTEMGESLRVIFYHCLKNRQPLAENGRYDKAGAKHARYALEVGDHGAERLCAAA